MYLILVKPDEPSFEIIEHCKEVFIYFSCSKPLLRTFIYITIDSP